MTQRSLGRMRYICRNKQRWATESDVTLKPGLSAYACRLCKGWHRTSQPNPKLSKWHDRG